MPHYRLIGHEAVECDLMEWALQMDDENRRVAKDSIGDVDISTVFLGLDHQFEPGGPPLIFETMIFGGPLDQTRERYSTWEQAEAGHARWVAAVKAS